MDGSTRLARAVKQRERRSRPSLTAMASLALSLRPTASASAKAGAHRTSLYVYVPSSLLVSAVRHLPVSHLFWRNATVTSSSVAAPDPAGAGSFPLPPQQLDLANVNNNNELWGANCKQPYLDDKERLHKLCHDTELATHTHSPWRRAAITGRRAVSTSCVDKLVSSTCVLPWAASWQGSDHRPELGHYQTTSLAPTACRLSVIRRLQSRKQLQCN
ncbi:hypothetical protein J6590_070465 [Homalodisca vitripennis]|nr:hypothetical protein J6590_070465 [Homalodisca vitripennis]